MDDYKEIFRRQYDQLCYLYAKANTKSKKAKIAYDLIFFEEMYNKFSDELVVFPWSDDKYINEERIRVADAYVENILKEQIIYSQMSYIGFNMFVEENFSLYTDYGKNYHKISGKMLQKYIFQFFQNLDKDLVERFKSKLLSNEMFINTNIGDYAGLTFPMESINKNIILFDSKDDMTINEARSLVHELGHDFEFENSHKSGVDNTWNKICRTSYVEVSSSFFEYAFINYLIENKIYIDDALMLKRRYLIQTCYFLVNILAIINIKDLKLDYNYCVTLDNVEYANSILDLINSCEHRYQEGDKLNLRTCFIYGVGKLLAIYIYELYRENSIDFLSKFKKSLLEYKDIGISAFKNLGVTEEELISGRILKRVLNDCKQLI